VRGAGESKRSGSLGGETAEGGELGDALPHGLDDAPAAGHGAAAHGEVAAEDDPVRNVERLEQTTGDQRGGDNAHAFLGVVGAVAQAVSSRGRSCRRRNQRSTFSGRCLRTIQLVAMVTVVATIMPMMGERKMNRTGFVQPLTMMA